VRHGCISWRLVGIALGLKREDKEKTWEREREMVRVVKMCRCEDVKMTCVDLKMRRCEDVKMTCVGAKMRSCEEERMICVDVKMRR
jgi:hypothetical protein